MTAAETAVCDASKEWREARIAAINHASHAETLPSAWARLADAERELAAAMRRLIEEPKE